MKNKGALLVLLVFLLVFGIAMGVMYFMFYGGVSNETEEAIIAECDKFVEEYDYSRDDHGRVDRIWYEIHRIRKDFSQVLVEITWYVDTEGSDDAGYWVSMVQNVLNEVELPSGKVIRVHYTDKEYQDSLCVVVNGGDPYSGYEDYLDAVTPKKEPVRERKAGVTDANACSRCSGTGYVTKHYGNSWNDKPGYQYGKTCGACGGSGIAS